MYHSHLFINVGDNPDRPDWRNCRRWLRNLYRVHQRLSMAYPSPLATAAGRPSGYCTPFDSGKYPLLCDLPDDDGGSERTRGPDKGFLFRIDYPVDYEMGGRRPVIFVQSAGEQAPDWNWAFGIDPAAVTDTGRTIGNASFLLRAKPKVKPVSIEIDNSQLKLIAPKEQHVLSPGDLVRFRLRANPTRKVQEGSPNGKRKRVDPTFEAHAQWLRNKLGVSVEGPICIENFVPGWAYGWRTKHEPQPKQRMQWWSVLFEGKFRLKDPTTLKTLLESGVGPGKAFGFGLLSVAPVR